MNVLLAEAEIPSDQVFEMDEINLKFSTTDVERGARRNMVSAHARLDTDLFYLDKTRKHGQNNDGVR